METNRTLNEELQEFSPQLSGLRKQEPLLEVPPNYFDGLTAKVIAEAKKEAIILPKRQFGWVKWSAGIAAIAAVLMGVLVWRNADTVTTTPTDCVQLACVSTEEILQYLESHPDAIDETVILEYISTRHLSTISVDETALEDYIEENEDEFSNTLLEDIL
jgi:hypothetical protein